MFLILISLALAFADTPPVSQVKSKTLDGSGTAITSTLIGGKQGLDVNVISSGSGGSTVNQGDAGSSGQAWYVQGMLGRTWNLSNSSDSVAAVQSGTWSVNVGNFPSTQPVSGSLGRTWNLSSGSDSVSVTGTLTASSASVGLISSSAPTSADQIGAQDSSGNLQYLKVDASKQLLVNGSGQTQPVSGTVAVSSIPAISGTVSVSNLPSTQPISGSVSVSNFPATQPVSGSVSVSSLPSVTGTVAVSNFPSSQNVSVSNFPATQTVSGSVIVNQAVGSSLHTNVDNFPATQPVSGTVAVSSLPAVSVSNFPSTQPVSGTVAVSSIPTNSFQNGSVNNVSVTSTASTVSVPSNAVGFILESDSTNSANIRWAVGSVASASVGTLMEPGRDTGYVPIASNISLISLSGTQTVSVQWVVK